MAKVGLILTDSLFPPTCKGDILEKEAVGSHRHWAMVLRKDGLDDAVIVDVSIANRPSPWCWANTVPTVSYTENISTNRLSKSWKASLIHKKFLSNEWTPSVRFRLNNLETSTKPLTEKATVQLQHKILYCIENKHRVERCNVLCKHRCRNESQHFVHWIRNSI